MVTSVMLTIPMVVLPLLFATPIRDCQFERMGDPVADAQAITGFEARVNDYMGLHRRLERAWPPMWFISDWEQQEFVAAEFRALLRGARPQATRGGFFTPEVASVFRFRTANTLRKEGFDVEAMTAPFDEDGSSAGGWTPVVNEPLPWNGMGSIWPLFTDLPRLPPELEYRLIGRDLVLLDARANMVLDILDLVVPPYGYRDSD
jgi:hypothetical protein